MRVFAVVVLLAVFSAPARADDKVAAEDLFLRGKELMKEGKTAEACDAFDRSNRLDPQIGTQYNLALCYEELGRLASAWALFREVAQRDTKAARRKDAEQHAAQLKPRLTKMLITLEGPTVPGLVVTRNLVDVTATVGIESAVDPGDYTLIASAPGYQPFTTEIRASGEGATVTVMIPILEERPEDGRVDTSEPVVEAPPGGDDDPEIDFTDRGGGGGGRKRLGLIVGAGGLAAAIAGGVFGVLAKGTWDDAKAICGGDLVCDRAEDEARADALAADARTQGNVSTVLVGVGAAAVATGVILWLTAPAGGGGERAVVPTISGDSIGVALWRTF